MRLVREDSLLLVIDIQRKLAPAIQHHERITSRTEALVTAAELFGIPKLITEHCPQQIGALVEPLRSRFGPSEIFEKTAFAATDHPEFVDRVRASGRRQVVMTGMEAHVCVMQAALGLLREGLEVCIAADAVGSRPAADLDRQLALARMAQAGCLVAGTETVLFEWTRYATDERFRSILALVKGF
ncbi:MAG: isochorismatase family protein [Burkholderiaceae bacterium]|jgi:nicotinamidase-related amidase|nr:isochorismatase family protein [Burkholderiaceae bacterium]